MNLKAIMVQNQQEKYIYLKLIGIIIQKKFENAAINFCIKTIKNKLK